MEPPGDASLLQTLPAKQQEELPFTLPEVPNEVSFAIAGAGEILRTGRTSANQSQVISALATPPRISIEVVGDGVKVVTLGAPIHGAPVAAACTSWLAASSMLACSEEETAMLRNSSSLLQRGDEGGSVGSGIEALFDDVVFLHGLGVTGCLAHRQGAFSSVAGENKEKPDTDRSTTILMAEGKGLANSTAMNGPRRRLVLDTRNDGLRFSSCCTVLEARGMARDARSSWLQQAIKAVPWRSMPVCEAGSSGSSCKKIVEYLEVLPQEGVCSASSRCPLVVQLPGGGDLVRGLGDPWLLVQAHCKACFEELHAVLISPRLFGGERSASSEAVEAALMPLIRSVLRESPGLDESRVYLVGQGRGAAIALHAALMNPQSFAAAVLSGTFDVPDVKRGMATNSAVLARMHGSRLRVLQFHVGGGDTDMESFVAQVQDVLEPFRSMLNIDVRVYTASDRSVWQGAFASMHDVIWTARQALVAETDSQGIPVSCGSMRLAEEAPPLNVLLSLVALGAVCSWSASLFRTRPGAGKPALQVQEVVAPGGGLWALLCWPWKAGSNSHPVPVGEALLHAASRRLSQGSGRGGGAIRSLLGLLRPESDRPALMAAEDLDASSESHLAPLSHSRLYMAVAETDLIDYGVASKERVVLLLPQGDLAACLIVALMARYTVIPLSADLRLEELQQSLLAAQSRVVITTSDVATRLFEFPSSLLVLVAESSNDTAGLFRLGRFGRDASPSRVRKSPRVAHTTPLNGMDDVALLLQTAGSTRRPRLLPHTLGSLALGSQIFVQAMELGDESVGLSLLPLHNMSGLVANLLCVLLSGGCVVCAPSLRQEHLRHWLQRHAVSYYSGLPSTHQAVLASFEELNAKECTSLHLKHIGSGGSPLPHPLALNLQRVGAGLSEDRSLLAVVPCYGTAECMPIAVCPTLERPGSVGLPVTELCLRPEDNQRPGKAGEVMVRGPLATSGELALSDEPMHKLSEGSQDPADGDVVLAAKDNVDAGAAPPLREEDWVPVGDVGFLDGDGHLFLVGRAREVINRAGELISPFELEDAMVGFPGVKQCMAFAVLHLDFGEAPALALVSEQPEIISLTEVAQFMARKLSAHKAPEALVFVNDIRQFAAGKSARIDFAARLGMPRFSSRTPLPERIFVARLAAHHHHRDGCAAAPVANAGNGQAMCLEPAPWLWLARRSTRDAEPSSKDSAFDSLGFARTMENRQDVQSTRVQKALYGLCSTAMLLQHSLPRGSLQAALAGEREWTLNLLEGITEFRPLLLLIFPLLGFFDGREALDGHQPLRRAPMVLAVYCAMAWPWFLPLHSGGFATFHRWPLWVWLWCIGACWLGRFARVSPWLQVVFAFGLAPFFSGVPDNLHERLGLTANPPYGVRQDPSLLFLEHRFHFSVGTKLYFIGCYLVAYHYLAREGATQRILQASRCKTGARFLALFALVALGAVCQRCATPFSDAASALEVSDWHISFGPMYPLTILVDWASLASIVVAVGEGVGLLRLAGACALGTLVAHMYIQLPFQMILRDATELAGPTGAFVAMFAVPVLYAISVGRVFQAMLTSPLRFFLNGNPQP